MVRPITEQEAIFTVSCDSEIYLKTAYIGYLRFSFGDGDEFIHSWNEFDSKRNTATFRSNLNFALNVCRKSFLHNLHALQEFIDSGNAYPLSLSDAYSADKDQYAVRVNAGSYAYIMRLCPNRGCYNVYIFAFERQFLDAYLKAAAQGIRFVDAKNRYKEVFRIKNGEAIKLIYSNGDIAKMTCFYIDHSHVLVGNQIYHVDQYADLLARCGATVLPFRNK